MRKLTIFSFVACSSKNHQALFIDKYRWKLLIFLIFVAINEEYFKCIKLLVVGVISKGGWREIFEYW